VTYTALLSLAILRDDFKRLDRAGLLKFLRACQREDGRSVDVIIRFTSLLFVDFLDGFNSFSTVPQAADSDLRTMYCAFSISSMLDDWSGVDVEPALAFIASCRV